MSKTTFRWQREREQRVQVRVGHRQRQLLVRRRPWQGMDNPRYVPIVFSLPVQRSWRNFRI